MKVEQLAVAATGVTGVVEDETAKWLAGLEESMYDKLAAVGLVAERTTVRLGPFVDGYIKERRDVKSGTATPVEIWWNTPSQRGLCVRSLRAMRINGAYACLARDWLRTLCGGGVAWLSNTPASQLGES